MTRLFRSTVLLCFTSLAGCVGYTPVAPHAGSVGKTRIRLETLTHILGSIHVTGRVETVAPGTHVKEVVIARAGADACRFGWAPSRSALIRPSGEATELDEWDLEPGDEIALFYTPENTKGIDKGARLDLLLERYGREECIAIPLTSNAPNERWERGRPVYLDFAMGGSGYAPHAGGTVADVDFRLGVGVGLGDIRPFAGAGVGFAACEDAICPPQILNPGTERERTARRLNLSVPMFVGVDMLPWQTGYFAFGSSVEYDVTFVRLQTYTEKRANWVHGFTVAPRLAVTYKDPLAPGLSGGIKNGFVALDFPIGFAHSLGLGGDVAFRYGMRIVLSVPLH